jgi:methionyl-tRNA formyltransferase
MRIMYMGTPDFAVPSLKAISEAGHEIVAVVTAPDRPAGRGQQIRMSPVKEFALKHNFKVLQPTNLKSDEFAKQVSEADPELMVVVAFRMLPESVWTFPSKGTINLHASLLPQYRGAAPINWAVINGERETGLTTFYIQKEIDTGHIIMQHHLSIGENESAGELHDRMMAAGAGLLVDTLESIATDQVVPIDQNDMIHGELKEAPKIFKDTCRIDWTRSLSEVHNHIRGLNPYPTAWSMLGEKSIKIFSAIKTDHLAGDPGIIIVDEGRLLVSCGDGVLQIFELQLAGKKRMLAADFLRGFNLESRSKLV